MNADNKAISLFTIVEALPAQWIRFLYHSLPSAKLSRLLREPWCESFFRDNKLGRVSNGVDKIKQVYAWMQSGFRNSCFRDFKRGTD